ncbi:dynamin family protein [Pseudanabaena sp. BC1403]|uniref:dynamin family protein n=1 Tax=Pseudanabaena sp. BC1403 TaxID=2043171 RepID=UPI000CD8491A|nr:dynamin family protein [Pseudanabaena sp. BC1403]
MSKNLSLIDHKQTLFKLTSQLRQLRGFAERLSLQSLITSIDDNLHRVETNGFSIAVVGEFKRGKSTFINALLGRDILPSDILPTTATLNRVTYGLKPLVKIQFKDGLEELIALEDLSNYVTKLTPEAEAISSTIQEAIVYYPVSYCQNNVDIIDTPGLSDDETMTAITLSVLPHVDVAILVIMAQSPLSESERDFLENHLLNESLGRILFVVTGIDRCNSPEDVEKIVANVESRIRNYIISGIENRYGKDSEEYKACISRIVQPKVFPISAYQALQAKQNHDNDLLVKSRFTEFERALETFLTEQRGIVFFQVPINRIISASKAILTNASQATNVLQQKQVEVQIKYEQEVERSNTQYKLTVETQQQCNEKVVQILKANQLFFRQVEFEINQAANHVIDTTLITNYDFNQSVLSDRMFKFDSKVAEALVICCRRLAGKIQMELQRELSTLPSDLKPSEENIRDFIKSIGIQFVNLAESFNKVIKEKRLAMQTSNSSKGLGAWLGNKLGNNDAIKVFKDNYKNIVSNEIAQQLKFTAIVEHVEMDIRNWLENIKYKVNDLKTEDLQSQNSLTEFQVQAVRDKTQIELEIQEIERIINQTQIILNDAQELSIELANLISKNL